MKDFAMGFYTGVSSMLIFGLFNLVHRLEDENEKLRKILGEQFV